MFLNNESRSFECILKESQGIPIPKRWLMNWIKQLYEANMNAHENFI